jgi:hypothetical protein
MRPAQSAKARAISTVSSSAVHLIVRFAVARPRRSALLRPRVRAAGGLDRPIREPLESNYRRPRVNLLTNARPRRYCRILFDGCGPQPLHIARCEAHESAASGHDSLLSRFTPWPPTCATTRPRNKRSERTALRLRPKRQIRPDFRFDIVALSRPLACQSSMHRSRTQCCPFPAERASETGIDVQHGQAYHGRTTTASARAAATTSSVRSHEREQPDRRAV